MYFFETAGAVENVVATAFCTPVATIIAEISTHKSALSCTRVFVAAFFPNNIGLL